MSEAMMDPTPTDWNGQMMQKRIARRYAAERRFKAMGFLAVALSATVNQYSRLYHHEHHHKQ